MSTTRPAGKFSGGSPTTLVPDSYNFGSDDYASTTSRDHQTSISNTTGAVGHDLPHASSPWIYDCRGPATISLALADERHPYARGAAVDVHAAQAWLDRQRQSTNSVLGKLENPASTLGRHSFFVAFTERPAPRGTRRGSILGPGSSTSPTRDQEHPFGHFETDLRRGFTCCTPRSRHRTRPSATRVGSSRRCFDPSCSLGGTTERQLRRMKVKFLLPLPAQRPDARGIGSLSGNREGGGQVRLT